jgi:phenylacetate-coenzyme A ligase PaaK-like adenylate-forming protein
MNKVAEIRHVQLEMLNQTLCHAVENTRYYARRFEGIPLQLESLEELSRLPILTREERALHTLDLLADGVAPEYVNVTSGTTFAGRKAGPPLLHFHDSKENQALHAVRALTLRPPEGQLAPLMLVLLSSNHGLSVTGAQPGTFAIPLEKRFHLAAIREILTRDFSFKGFMPRVQALSGPLNMLKLLTLLCMEEGIAASEFDLKVVTTQGWHLTERWQRILESFWGVNVDDVYGLSEAPGCFGRRCRACGRFHLSAYSIVETLKPNGVDPVVEGCARLVVTSLYPLAQAQPTIRYDTQDLVWVAPCAKTGERSCDLLGRKRDAIFVEDDPEVPVLTPLALHGVLDAVPQVAQHRNPRAEALGLKTSFGWPKYKVKHDTNDGRTAITLSVELRWSPRLYPPQAEALRAELEQAIMKRFPELPRAIERGRAQLVIDFAEPDTTDYAMVI